MNELSGTIDLESTLIRAESLFRRFQRTVEAIDKKNNFPSPKVRQRRPVNDPRSPVARSSATEDSPRSPQENGRTITPQLRSLLSRKVETLDKQTVQEHGGGV